MARTGPVRGVDEVFLSDERISRRKPIIRGGDFPKHLAGRIYGSVVHGDVAGTEGARRALADWLDWMGWIDAGALARIDRMIGYSEPYATSHLALDADTNLQAEVANVARAVSALRVGKQHRADEGIEPPARSKSGVDLSCRNR